MKEDWASTLRGAFSCEDNFSSLNLYWIHLQFLGESKAASPQNTGLRQSSPIFFYSLHTDTKEVSSLGWCLGFGLCLNYTYVGPCAEEPLTYSSNTNVSFPRLLYVRNPSRQKFSCLSASALIPSPCWAAFGFACYNLVSCQVSGQQRSQILIETLTLHEWAGNVCTCSQKNLLAEVESFGLCNQLWAFVIHSASHSIEPSDTLYSLAAHTSCEFLRDGIHHLNGEAGASVQASGLCRLVREALLLVTLRHNVWEAGLHVGLARGWGRQRPRRPPVAAVCKTRKKTLNTMVHIRRCFVAFAEVNSLWKGAQKWNLKIFSFYQTDDCVASCSRRSNHDWGRRSSKSGQENPPVLPPTHPVESWLDISLVRFSWQVQTPPQITFVQQPM